ncbi:MAG: hypothetical protein QNL68_11250 [Akkermansiaceae bacterium]
MTILNCHSHRDGLLGVCFLRGAPEDVVEEIGEGEGVGNSLSGDGKGNGNQAAASTGTGGNTLTLADFGMVDGEFQSTVSGGANTGCRIESSPTLEGAWAFEENITTDRSGIATVIDDALPSARKFYRAVER